METPVFRASSSMRFNSSVDEDEADFTAMVSSAASNPGVFGAPEHRRKAWLEGICHQMLLMNILESTDPLAGKIRR